MILLLKVEVVHRLWLSSFIKDICLVFTRDTLSGYRSGGVVSLPLVRWILPV
jgi:hypothetical protein